MTCTDKKRYPDKLAADIDLSSIIGRAEKHRKNRNKVLPVRSYECPWCGGHHLTSQAKGQPELKG